MIAVSAMLSTTLRLDSVAFAPNGDYVLSLSQVKADGSIYRNRSFVIKADGSAIISDSGASMGAVTQGLIQQLTLALNQITGELNTLNNQGKIGI